VVQDKSNFNLINNYQYQWWSHTRRRHSRNNYQKSNTRRSRCSVFLRKKVLL